MRYAIPVVIVVAFTAWIMDLRRRGEPVGPALAAAAKRWGPVVLLGFVVYGLLTMLMSILALVLALMVIWMIVGIFTGGFLWADSSFADSMGAFGVVLAVIAVVVCVLLIVATVSLVKVLRRRMRDWNANPVAVPVAPPSPCGRPGARGRAPGAHTVAPGTRAGRAARTTPEGGRALAQ